MAGAKKSKNRFTADWSDQPKFIRDYILSSK